MGKQLPEICPKCKHEITDFMGCDDCQHFCVSYIMKNNLYIETKEV